MGFKWEDFVFSIYGGMDTKFSLMHLYNKRVLSHGAFRVFRLLLDIRNENPNAFAIKASRRHLMIYTGLSENALKSALDELIRLKIVALKGERPSLWVVNDASQFDLEALNKLVAGESASANSEADTAE